MRSDISILDWITPKQATQLIKDLTGNELCLEDLSIQCENNNCWAYILPKNLEGTSLEALLVDGDEYTQDCQGSGYQKIIYPPMPNATSSKIEVTLHGSVITTHGINTEHHNGIEWKTTINPKEYEIRFFRKEIESLCKKIQGTTKELDPRERDSLLQIIYLIGKMNQDFDFFGSKSLAEAMIAKAKELKIKPLSATTIDKHLSAAKDLCG